MGQDCGGSISHHLVCRGEQLQRSFFLLGSGMMIMLVKDRSIIILLGEMSVLVLPGRLC